MDTLAGNRIKLKTISRTCSGGKCPTLYVSEEGHYYIQGYSTDAFEQAALALPDGEQLVRISQDLIDDIKNLK
ncbi:hypothetical protein NKJ06_29660 [Mesorhizobium sp. M0293]|uniref:hypothetical protein n=1 Tax=Mesorhizobium sp. M0293 TaxID=2956930 RepID=UPI0033369295